jgi:hypothetical protein
MLVGAGKLTRRIGKILPTTCRQRNLRADLIPRPESSAAARGYDPSHGAMGEPRCSTSIRTPSIPCGHFIDGMLVTGPSAMAVRRPCDGKVYAELPVADAGIVDRAVRCDARAEAGDPRARRQVAAARVLRLRSRARRRLHPRSILGNAGQVCVAGSRLIVHRKLRDELIDRLSARMPEAAPGLTWRADTAYSPIISQRQLERVDGIVRRTLDAGAEAVVAVARCRGRRMAPSTRRPSSPASTRRCRRCARRSSARC